LDKATKQSIYDKNEPNYMIILLKKMQWIKQMRTLIISHRVLWIKDLKINEIKNHVLYWSSGQINYFDVSSDWDTFSQELVPDIYFEFFFDCMVTNWKATSSKYLAKIRS
jgi:hypothetical protein